MADLAGKTFIDLKAAFELHTDTSEEVDAAELAIWFNEAQLDIAVDCGVKDMPAMFTGAGASMVCGLPPVLHDLLPLFAASRYWDRESGGDREESDHATKWMEYYLRQKEQCKRMLNLAGDMPRVWKVI